MSNTQLAEIHNRIEELLQTKADALPSDLNKTRFLQNAMTVLSTSKGIENCKPTNVARVVLQGALLGLDFFNKECYAIIYGGVAQFQTDYKGEIKLAKKYATNKIKDIYSKLVREGDEFIEEIVAGQQSIHFKPLPFNNKEIVGAFAVVLYEDGSMMYDTMSSEEIENTREHYSKQPDGKAWKKSKGEMYKKTPLRRLLKYIDLHFETTEQKSAFDDASDMDFTQETKPQQQSPLNANKTIIDAEYTVVEESPNETE